MFNNVSQQYTQQTNSQVKSTWLFFISYQFVFFFFHYCFSAGKWGALLTSDNSNTLYFISTIYY